MEYSISNRFLKVPDTVYELAPESARYCTWDWSLSVLGTVRKLYCEVVRYCT